MGPGRFWHRGGREGQKQASPAPHFTRVWAGTIGDHVFFSKFLGGLEDVDFFIGSLLRGSGRGGSSQRSGQAFPSLKSGTHSADPWQGPTGEASFWGWWR